MGQQKRDRVERAIGSSIKNSENYMKIIVVNPYHNRKLIQISDELFNTLAYLDYVTTDYCQCCRGYHASAIKIETVINILSDHTTLPTP